MKAPSEDIMALLGGISSFGLVPGENLFVAREPATPANTVTIFDTPGFSPHLGFDKNEDYEYRSIQIRVRATNYTDGMKLAQDITTLLHGRANDSCSGSIYTVVFCSSPPALLEWDNNNRVILVINFDLQRRKE